MGYDESNGHATEIQAGGLAEVWLCVTQGQSHDSQKLVRSGGWATKYLPPPVHQKWCLLNQS